MTLSGLERLARGCGAPMSIIAKSSPFTGYVQVERWKAGSALHLNDLPGNDLRSRGAPERSFW